MGLTDKDASSRQSIVTKIRTYLPHILLVGTLLIFGTYLWRNSNRYRQLFDFSFYKFFSLLCLAIIFTLINGSINYFFYRALNITLEYNESIGLAAVNSLANQLPFAGGLVAKGAYLKQRYHLGFTRFLSAMMALYVCFVAVNGKIALLVLGYWLVFQGIKVPLSLVAGFLLMALSIISFWLPFDKLPLPRKFDQRLAQLVDGWVVLRENIGILIIMIGFQVLTLLLFAGRMWISFHALSQNVSYAECLLFSSATVLTRLVSVAPGGLGVREGIVAGLASVLGFAPGVGVVAVGLDRMVETIVILILGSFYSYHLSKKVFDSEEFKKE